MARVLMNYCYLPKMPVKKGLALTTTEIVPRKRLR